MKNKKPMWAYRVNRCETAVLQIKMKMDPLVRQLMIHSRNLRGLMVLRGNRLLIRLLLNSQKAITAKWISAHWVSSENLKRFLKWPNRTLRSPISQVQIRNTTFLNIHMIDSATEMTVKNLNPNRMEQKIYRIYKLWIQAKINETI